MALIVWSLIAEIQNHTPFTHTHARTHMHRNLFTPYTDPQIPDTHRHTNSPINPSFTHTHTLRDSCTS